MLHYQTHLAAGTVSERLTDCVVKVTETELPARPRIFRWCRHRYSAIAFYLVVLVYSWMLIASVSAATYYVAADGDDSNPGTELRPWKTISRATKNYPWYIEAGDTVIIRGGTYFGNANAIDLGDGIGRSGTAANPITIKAYPGEVPIVANTTAPYAGITLKNKQFWIFDGITYSNCYSAVYHESCSYFIYTNCTFTTINPTSYRWAAFSLCGESQYNRIVNCVFSGWGFVRDSDGSDEGTPLAMGNENSDDHTWYNLIENCRFFHNGHDNLQMNTAYNVFRKNDFHNENWMPTNQFNYLIADGETNMYRLYGNRNTKPGDAGDYQIDQRNVFEYNRFHYAGVPPDDGGAFGIELGTHESIYRFNTIAFTLAAGVYFNTSGTDSMSNSNAFYNNVIFGCGLSHRFGGSRMQDYSYGLTASGFEAARRRTNNYIVNNIFWANLPGNVDPFVITSQQYRTNWSGDLPLPDPGFVNTNGYGDFFRLAGAPDFRLQAGSPCVDAGTWLAFVTSADGTGSSFAVDNSLYFSDGNRIVPGDTIQLQGQTVRVVLTGVDTRTHTLSFSSTLTWTNGQGVSLAYSGTAPDMGAFERSSLAPPGRLYSLTNNPAVQQK